MFRLIIFIFLIISPVTYAKDELKAKLLAEIQQYSSSIQSAKFGEAEPSLKSAYQLAKQYFPDGHQNIFNIGNDYGFVLLQLKKDKQAAVVFKELLTNLEKQYGKYSEKLIPTLSDLKFATSTFDKKLSQAYMVRASRLTLRHQSAQYVEKFKDQTYRSTQHSKNLLAAIQKATKNNYQIFDAGKWDLIYNADGKKNFKRLLTQMSLSYDSALGFLIAFNVISKPSTNKLTAVFFETREDYQRYLLSLNRDSAERAAQGTYGVYSHVKNALFLFNRQGRQDEEGMFGTFSTLRHEIAHQLFFNLGLQSVKSFNYPRWLSEGLATSLEFHEMNEISGAQTNNIPFRRLEGIKRLKKKNQLPTLEDVISLGQGHEGERKYFSYFYQMSGFIVRFLYLNYPDDFREYIKYLTKTPYQRMGRRGVVFYRHFGEREKLQKEFDDYLTEVIAVMDEEEALVKQ